MDGLHKCVLGKEDGGLAASEGKETVAIFRFNVKLRGTQLGF
jgi:hypothetical protein